MEDMQIIYLFAIQLVSFDCAIEMACLISGRGTAF